MSNNKKSVKLYLCPACFAREIDVLVMKYDHDDEEYYCTKCAYTAKQEVVDEFYKEFKKQKYRDMLKPHPFEDCK